MCASHAEYVVRSVSLLAALVGLLAPEVANALPTLGARPPEYRWESTFTGPGVDDIVTAAAVWDDGSGPALYVAGLFATAGERQVNRIAR